MQAFLANTLQPTIKSEPIPFPSSSSPSALVKVVGATYHAIVDDTSRDVLLTVCIEQCAPCARLYPVLEDLAEMYAEREREGNGGETKTTVATVLYDLNDTGLRGIRAFPTILLFRAGAVSSFALFWKVVEGSRGLMHETVTDKFLYLSRRARRRIQLDT